MTVSIKFYRREDGDVGYRVRDEKGVLWIPHEGYGRLSDAKVGARLARDIIRRLVGAVWTGRYRRFRKRINLRSSTYAGGKPGVWIQVVAGNAQIVATHGRSYRKMDTAEAAAKRMQKAARRLGDLAIDKATDKFRGTRR